MNAIISLCHFCELHGPRVVFNTQSFRDFGFYSSQSDNDDLTKQKLSDTDRSWKYGSINQEEEGEKNFPSAVSETCAACKSFGHIKPGIVTDDDNEEVSYVSSQFPLQNDLFTLVRQACIRSLSCEVCSEREGPIYFGDSARGHVISYTFFLKDIQARGFQKWYSILVFMRDKMFLLNSWPFFIENIEDIIHKLQKRASSLYSKEEEEKKKKKKQTCLVESTKRQRESSAPRSLADLVEDKNVWRQLHKHFTWILKAGGRRLEERMVRGPPLEIPQFELNDGISPREFLSLIGEGNFLKVLHHLYVGNEIILKSSNEALLLEITNVLKIFLPPFLFHPCHNPKEEDSLLHSNILTVLLSTSGSSVEFPFYGLSLIFIAKEKLQKIQNLPESLSSQTLLDFSVKLIEPVSLDSRPPQIVAKVHKFFSEQHVSTEIFNLFLTTIFEEWTNKVKIWSYINTLKESDPYHQCPQGFPMFLSANDGRKCRSTPPSPRSSSPTPSAFLSRSPSPSAFLQSNSKHSQILLAVGALECDVPLLEAWTKYYKLSEG